DDRPTLERECVPPLATRGTASRQQISHADHPTSRRRQPDEDRHDKTPASSADQTQRRLPLQDRQDHGSIFLPAGFFFSVLSPKVTEPNAIIYLAFIGAVVLAAALVTLGVGLLKKQRSEE